MSHVTQATGKHVRKFVHQIGEDVANLYETNGMRTPPRRGWVALMARDFLMSRRVLIKQQWNGAPHALKISALRAR